MKNGEKKKAPLVGIPEVLVSWYNKVKTNFVIVAIGIFEVIH